MSMKSEEQSAVAGDLQMDGTVPSADYIQAISQFLETDPSDLLAELGYYDRGQRQALADVVPVAD
jgi:hypothetical protein